MNHLCQLRLLEYLHRFDSVQYLFGFLDAAASCPHFFPYFALPIFSLIYLPILWLNPVGWSDA